jgi:hypothetical protein
MQVPSSAPANSPKTEGSETLVYLASSPEVAGITGEYFHKQHPVQPSKITQDDDAGNSLWQESSKLAELPE